MNTAFSTPPTIASEKSEWTSPRVYLGHIVRWFSPGKEVDNCVAVVQRVNADGSVALSIIPPPYGGVASSLINQEKVSVLHKDDPRMSGDYRSRYGCWDITEQDRQFRELQVSVETLHKRVKAAK